ncbi:MAG: DUF2147 domain-containing protein [Pseudomonadota bacterium]
MKKLIAAAAALMMTSGASFADPAAGLWQSERSAETGRFMHVRLAPCGSEVCGTIQTVFDPDNKPIANHEFQGKRMIWAMKPQGNGAYADGQIWAPDDEKTYESKMQLKSASQLEVEGCVLFICRGQTWRRVQ